MHNKLTNQIQDGVLTLAVMVWSLRSIQIDIGNIHEVKKACEIVRQIPATPKMNITE